jgi:predicted metallopeptidase
MLFSGGVRRRNQLRNQRTIYTRYQQYAEDIDRRVQAARSGVDLVASSP